MPRAARAVMPVKGEGLSQWNLDAWVAANLEGPPRAPKPGPISSQLPSRHGRTANLRVRVRVLCRLLRASSACGGVWAGHPAAAMAISDHQ